MHLPTFTLSVLAVLAANIHACAKYDDCKCHDSQAGGMQNNGVTESACKKYNEDFGAGVTYLNGTSDHHQCSKNHDHGGSVMDNCDWDKTCKFYGQQYYQYCWNKNCVADIFC